MSPVIKLEPLPKNASRLEMEDFAGFISTKRRVDLGSLSLARQKLDVVSLGGPMRGELISKRFSFKFMGGESFFSSDFGGTGSEAQSGGSSPAAHR